MNISRRLWGIVAVMVLAVVSLAGSGARTASAPVSKQAVTLTYSTEFQRTVTGSAFEPGDIISDAVFFDGDALAPIAVQAFLEARVPVCADSTVPCLRDYAERTRDLPADGECDAYIGAERQTAAEIVSAVGAACGINQGVLLALVQKEQSLVDDSAPSERAYRSATGYGCPDTADCDEDYYGFFGQVYGAAWQFKRYADPESSFVWYPVGEVSSIAYSPDAACAGAPVLIRNTATAGLYYYTPYQPNEAALANLYGSGDACSSYGNRNFWKIFTNWFGDTHAR